MPLLREQAKKGLDPFRNEYSTGIIVNLLQARERYMGSI
jgi:hypothetical protein